MIYSELVRKACNIMYQAHGKDVDRGGYPYVFHPFFLATQMDDEASACVALLHDVIEDHGDKYTFEKLEEEGFSPEILDALRLLTHAKDVPYMDYIREIATNPIASKVKLADLKHNSDTRRTDGKVPPKFDTYRQAIKYLETGADSNKNVKYLTEKALPPHDVIVRFPSIGSEKQLNKVLGNLKVREKSGLWALLGKTDPNAKKWICIEVGHGENILEELRKDIKAMFLEPELFTADTAFHDNVYSYLLHMEKLNFKYRAINRRFVRFKLIQIKIDDYLEGRKKVIKNCGIALTKGKKGNEIKEEKAQLAEVLFANEAQALFWNPAPAMNGNREKKFHERLVEAQND